MMSSLEFEGKNVDKAVKSACDELNIVPDKLNFEVLSRGSSGIFGFGNARKARIRIHLPERPPETVVDAKPETHDTPVREEAVHVDAQVSEFDISDGLQPLTFEKKPVDLAQEVLQHIIDAITSDATIAAAGCRDGCYSGIIHYSIIPYGLPTRAATKNTIFHQVVAIPRLLITRATVACCASYFC